MGGIAVVGTKGSPGTTTLALALGAVWPRPVAVAECDPCGGDIACRFGLPAHPGMASCVLMLRRDWARPTSNPKGLAEHTQELPGGMEVIVGSTAGDSALALDHELAGVAKALCNTAESGQDLILDCGRFLAGASGQLALLREAEKIVLVAKPEPASLLFAHWMATDICAARQDHRDLVLAVVGDRPLRPAEMAGALSVELLGSIPIDAVGAALIGGKPGRRGALARSALISTATRLARILATPKHCEGSEAAASAIPHEEHRDVG